MKTLLIICNGPSTQQLNWDFLKKNKNKIDTFCLNSSYKKFEKLGFYPTYFGCFDRIVGKFHEKEFQKLLLNKNNNIKKFFFLNNLNLTDPYKRLKLIHLKTQGKLEISKSFINFNNWLNSGSNSFQIGLMLGYRKIYLIGVDGYKTNIIPEATKINNKLVMKETPKTNVNYWFNDYQEKGEIFNVPNQHIYHVPGWKICAYISHKYKINVFNLSNKNYIRYFKFKTLKEFYKKFI